jgi:NTE family protein
MPRPRIALALGSGGMKGMAHVGVLRALEEAEIRPTVYAGSSAGALVAAAAAHGIALAEMESIADRLRRKPLFQIDFLSLVRHGLRAQALYRAAPLRELCAELFGRTTFREIKTPLVVSSVDVETAVPLWWSAASWPDVPVADTVYASCAMPGLLPPGRVCGRICVDGGVLDPLALRGVAPLADLVIAVVLDGTAPPARNTATVSTAPTLWWHAQRIVTHDIGHHTLARWDGPPLLAIRPDLHHVHSLRGADPALVIRAGYDAARTALDRWDGLTVSVGDAHRIF